MGIKIWDLPWTPSATEESGRLKAPLETKAHVYPEEEA